MRVRVIGFGVNWWSAHSPDLSDPFCFRRCAAWFNSAGLMYGRRLRLCWVFPGHIRFNRTSGFHSEFPNRSLGRTFECSGPVVYNGRTHLLFRLPAKDAAPDRYLVELNECTHGTISFATRAWRSGGVAPISVSLRGKRYEVLALMNIDDWIQTGLGRWILSADCARLVLDTGSSESTR